MERTIQINNLSWKASLKNYSSVLAGVAIYGVSFVGALIYFVENAKEWGTLAPLVLVSICMIFAKLTRIIPRPISTYEVLEVKEE